MSSAGLPQSTYPVLREPRREMLRIRGLNLAVRRWGPPPPADVPPIVMLHGWLDTGDSFQFIVDAFEHDWPLIALDWRGFGRSQWSQDGYWFPDYLADLDALLESLSPGVPVRLVGHSMGGNIAMLYAGLRPERVHSVVNLEGFGLPDTEPTDAPARLRQWLGEVKAAPGFKEYESPAQLAAIIGHRYPRISPQRCAYLAATWSASDAGGRVRLLGDARHYRVNPILYRRQEAEACWREVRAPVQLLLADESAYLVKLGLETVAARFRACIPHIEIINIAGVGHLLHMERPEVIAPLVEAFLLAH
jgi:pimeloyl-ACP methyl ester carboxylesterase